MSDLFNCAWREIQRRKARTTANLIGFTLTVAILIVMVSLMQFARDAAGKVLATTGTHFIAFAPRCVEEKCAAMVKDSAHEGFIANGVFTKLLEPGDLKKIVPYPAIKEISPYLLFKMRDKFDGHAFTIGGFDLSDSSVVGSTCCAPADLLPGGRFLRPDDSEKILLEEAYARERGQHVGDLLLIDDQAFTVIGIVNPGDRPAKADVYLPYAEAERVIAPHLTEPLKDRMNIILVQVANAKQQRDAIRRVQSILPEAISSSSSCWKPAVQVMGMNEQAVGLLTIIIALATVALALRSQWASVLERRHDIGILKALGWTNRIVVSLLVLESLLQAVLGGLLGCLLAVVILLFTPIRQIIGATAMVQITLSPLVMAGGLLLAIAGGIIAGLIPAWHAARQCPADALRQV